MTSSRFSLSSQRARPAIEKAFTRSPGSWAAFVAVFSAAALDSANFLMGAFVDSAMKYSFSRMRPGISECRFMSKGRHHSQTQGLKWSSLCPGSRNSRAPWGRDRAPLPRKSWQVRRQEPRADVAERFRRSMATWYREDCGRRDFRHSQRWYRKISPLPG